MYCSHSLNNKTIIICHSYNGLLTPFNRVKASLASLLCRYLTHGLLTSICEKFFFLQLPISLQIEKTTYCKDTIGLWKYHQSHPRVKACKLPSFWMYDIQSLTNATHACPLPKVRHFLMIFQVQHVVQLLLISELIKGK